METDIRPPCSPAAWSGGYRYIVKGGYLLSQKGPPTPSQLGPHVIEALSRCTMGRALADDVTLIAV